MNEEHAQKTDSPVRSPSRTRVMTSEDQADLDAFRSLQPLSLRGVAKSLEKRIRPRTEHPSSAADA